MKDGRYLIIQIYGKHSNDKYKKIRYEIEGKSYESRLSSGALLQHYGNADLLYLIPESLFINDVKNTNEFENFMKENYKEVYKNAIINQLEMEKINIKINKIYSIGFYDNSGTQGNKITLSVEFRNNIDGIKLKLFRDIFKIINNYDNIIIDLSTGLNYYIPIIIDVIRNIITYQKLSHYIDRNNFDKKYNVTVVPPVGDSKTTIHFETIDAVAYFDLIDVKKFELSPSDSTNTDIIIKTRKEFEDNIDKLNKIMNITKIGLNALKNNTPLVFYDQDILDIDEDKLNMTSNQILEDYIFKIIDYLTEYKIEINNNHIIVSRPKIDGLKIMKFIMGIGIYESIRKIRYDIQKDFKNVWINEKNAATIEDIEARFTKIYQKLNYNVNIKFLERDLKEIKSLKIDGSYRLISELKYGNNTNENSGNDIKNSDIKRNFFAHSGFEYKITQVRKDNDKIFIMYIKNEKKNEIERWLLDQS
ncbi:MAG: TM1812 family CRISPR-associated protein [Thermoplasmata archaeon]